MWQWRAHAYLVQPRQANERGAAGEGRQPQSGRWEADGQAVAGFSLIISVVTAPSQCSVQHVIT